ncbi:minor fimbrial subunit [Enterobacter asburiae]|jgi:minor fimbrial subunit|uniref:fimbrial protein n=1 Tax=Enterobacter TaxID=547 RepID=UPI00067EB391|nr:MULTISPECIES: fimbrial protein [Enterobacter]ELP5717216.1 type 1 fimbrial protein [Enterobacter asburiae]EMA4738256.1 type 1 fimbrial protein [Enterobacter asburiae]EMA4739927.1 type 1 fimbrial protein [Enterobacter asburiae]NIH88741.1 minor fimbrial subunit [Enterobacter asburiae]
MRQLLIFVVFFLRIFEANAAGTSVNINITGKIITPPCVVDTNTVNQTVDLKKDYVHNLTAGNGSSWTSFQLSLSKCPTNWTSVTVAFTGTPAADDSYFANSGTAKGVVLQISDSGHKTSYGNGDKITETVDETRNVTFPLEARMYSPDGQATGGSFNALVQVDFTYQ